MSDKFPLVSYWRKRKGEKREEGKGGKKEGNEFKAVLRIHLILMQIRILDPHWKKMDPNSLFSLNLLTFINKAEFSNFLSYFFAYLYAKT